MSSRLLFRFLKAATRLTTKESVPKLPSLNDRCFASTTSIVGEIGRLIKPDRSAQTSNPLRQHHSKVVFGNPHRPHEIESRSDLIELTTPKSSPNYNKILAAVIAKRAARERLMQRHYLKHHPSPSQDDVGSWAWWTSWGGATVVGVCIGSAIAQNRR